MVGDLGISVVINKLLFTVLMGSSSVISAPSSFFLLLEMGEESRGLFEILSESASDDSFASSDDETKEILQSWFVLVGLALSRTVSIEASLIDLSTGTIACGIDIGNGMTGTS